MNAHHFEHSAGAARFHHDPRAGRFGHEGGVDGPRGRDLHHGRGRDPHADDFGGHGHDEHGREHAGNERGGHEHGGHEHESRADSGFEGRGFGRGFGPGRGFPGFPGFPGDFGPGARRGGRRASKGDVRAAILSLLAENPASGYGLIQAIAEKTDGAWRPSPGSVYPTLQQLVDEELISSVGDGRRTEYTLTDAGTTYVEEHADELARAWEATPRRSEGDRALFESIGKLMGVVHQLRFADEKQRAAAIEKLDETRRALYLILAD